MNRNVRKDNLVRSSLSDLTREIVLLSGVKL